MTRVIFAEGCREIDAPSGRRYYAGHGDHDRRGYTQGGSFDMSAADAKLAVRMGGAVASLVAGVSVAAVGFRCQACGFGSYFRHCGRCGSEQTVRDGAP